MPNRSHPASSASGAAETNGAPPSPSGPDAGLRTLLAEIVDYAGLFPPADLSLDAAIQNYARYRREPEAWMLARFVIPAGRLADLDDYAPLFTDDARRPRQGAPPFRFSVLGTGGNTPKTFLDALEQDLNTIEAFLGRREGRATADVMEVRLPEPLLQKDTGAIAEFASAVQSRIVAAGLSKLDCFFEVPLRADARELTAAVCEALADHNSRQPVPLRAEMGLKIRCGGLEPNALPTPAHVTTAIAACRRTGVRFKATAGLHHPLRHYDDEIGAWHHGFFNVFGAAVLAGARNLDEAVIRDILQDQDPDHFRFTPDTFAWNNRSAPLDDIARARDRLAVSFGSCSFEEPCDDLREMGLL